MNSLSLRLPKIRVQTIQWLEVAFTFLLLLTFAERSNIPLLKSFGQVFSYPFLFISIVCRWKRFCSLLCRDWILVGLTLLAVMSVVWSVAPDTTFPVSRGLLRSTFFGIYLAMRYSLKDQLRFLAGVFSILAVLSFLVPIVMPSVGIHVTGPHVGIWRGVFIHKNFLGRNMTISAQVFLLLALYYKRWQLKYFLYLGFALSVALVLLSRSTTALAALLSVTPLILAYKTLQQPFYKSRVVASMLVVLSLIGTSILVALSAEALLATQGKDLTLTGRTRLWDILINDFFSVRPFWGYGYRAFWPTYSEEIAFGGWLPGHAHNSFIELSLDLGLVGIVLYLCSLLSTVFRAFLRMFSAKSVLDFWYLQFFLILLIIDSMGMSTVLDPVNLQWMLFVCATFSLKFPRKQQVLSSESS